MKLNKKQVAEIFKEKRNQTFIGDEKKFQKYIVERIDEICKNLGLPNIKYIETQKVIEAVDIKIIPDIYIVHKDGTGTIFEVKCSNDKNGHTSANEQVKAIGQLLLYRNVVKMTRNNFPLVYMVSDKIFNRTLSAFYENNLPIGLIEIQNDRVFVPRNIV